MNQIRVVTSDSDRNALRVMSTFVASESLEKITDEAIDFRDSDLVVINNRCDRRCSVRFKDYATRGGPSARCVIQPARQRTFTVREGDKDGAEVVLGAGESVVIRADVWKAQIGRGRGGPLV